MRKTAIVIFFILIGVLFPSNRTAADNKGSDIIVLRLDGIETAGELIAVKRDSLLILDKSEGKDVTFYFEDIDRVKIINQTNWFKNCGIGFLSGTAAGLMGARIWASAEPYSYYVVVSPLLFGSIGIACGSLISLYQGKDRIIVFWGKPIEMLEKEINYLRKKARIKDVN